MRFTKDHEWVRLEGDVATVGISKHAAEALGDVVFVETPEAGRSVSKGDSFAVVESVKAASDVYAPVAGEVVEGNAALANAPETVNADPEGEGWFAKIKVSDASQLDELMDRAAYDQYLATL
ncbi:glycine cleavage system protein GcvH [Brevundimonas viscosa]|uniref:Glycine cleavage system H protein n=1 Tax=Brevundimonas viscosa TaxID=871741 RepID=A0A1I6QDV4_9CAUL|nr:glycine cleavage system protein GcvH [Brevundimonas viscosa]SFS50647.1 glycine cleavage system H protein [Brevundimonas viscosa]